MLLTWQAFDRFDLTEPPRVFRFVSFPATCFIQSFVNSQMPICQSISHILQDWERISHFRFFVACQPVRSTRFIIVFSSLNSTQSINPIHYRSAFLSSSLFQVREHINERHSQMKLKLKPLRIVFRLNLFLEMLINIFVELKQEQTWSK